MIDIVDVSLHFPNKKLFDEVNLKFTPGNCYGVIGANGAGKSTFLKIISGELEATSGHVTISDDTRISVLNQDHYAFDQELVINTVIMGNKKLYNIMAEKDKLYSKLDFSDEDGIRASELEIEFADLDGWNAESEASSLLQGLGIPTGLHNKIMAELNGNEKVKVLLAQALFGKPGVLILDEPTNNLDIDSILWLQSFLISFEGTIIVVSHDRHFLNNVCTHMADVDFGKIELYPGNYDFWYQSSQLALQMAKEQNKKKEEKAKELETFIARFSANASKSKQATSRKKLLDKLTIDDIKPSTRRYPFLGFDYDRDVGNDILIVENLSKTIDGVKVLDNISFRINKDDKIAFISENELSNTSFFKIITGQMEADSGSYKWGITITNSYFPKDNSEYFKDSKLNLIDWLRQFSKDKSETYIRSFLGRMLFSGDDVFKKVNVLSGGEKVRCMLAKMMLEEANLLILDQPTNHLDLESITALNNGLKDFKSNILFSSYDYEFINTIANRIIEFTPTGFMDEELSYDDYISKYKKTVS